MRQLKLIKIKAWGSRRLIIVGLGVIALPLIYFTDVLIIGSIAAAIHDLGQSFRSVSVLYVPEELSTVQEHSQMLTYITAHPFSTGLAWLTKTGRELTHPEVRTIWLGLHLVLIPIVLGWHWRRKKGNDAHRAHGLRITDNPAHGTSRWAAFRDVSHLCAAGFPAEGTAFPGGILLGALKGKIIRAVPGKSPIGSPPLAGHAAVFGGTGSGKSYSFVMGNIISAVADGQSFVVTDPKGELAENTAPWLESRGYEVRVFNLNNPVHSHTWNPLIECRDEAEIAEMASCFILNAADDDQGYFVSKEIQLLEALAGLLKGDFPVAKQHMRSLMSLSAWNKEQLEARFKEAYQGNRISPAIYERWLGCSSANLEHAFSGLTAKLRMLTTEPLTVLMGSHELDLASLGERKTAIFCVLPVRGEKRILRPIVATFYYFLFKRLYELAENKEDRKLPVAVRFLLDELANIGKIPGFTEIISTARSLGIHLQLVLQGRSQLDEVYGREDAKTILANCPTLLLLGVAPGDLETAELFSRILGKTAVRGLFESDDQTVPLASRFQLKSKTERVIERSLMTPDEIARMQPIDCIAVIQWCYPLYLRKVGWTELPQGGEIRNRGTVSLKEYLPARMANPQWGYGDRCLFSEENKGDRFDEPVIQSQENERISRSW